MRVFWILIFLMGMLLPFVLIIKYGETEPGIDGAMLIVELVSVLGFGIALPARKASIPAETEEEKK